MKIGRVGCFFWMELLKFVMRQAILSILLFLFAFPYAQATRNDIQVGNWLATIADDTQIAATSNSSGFSVGIYCALSLNKCFAFVVTDTNCEEGQTFPILASSSIGASSLHTTCRKIGTSICYVITEYEYAKQIFENGGEIGLVFPLKGGQFRVARFNVDGGAAAIKLVTTPPTKSKTPTADEVL